MLGISAKGTAFWAMSTETNTKTKQQLEAEESVGQSSDLSKTSEASKTQEKIISPNDNEQTVLFADPTNGNLVKIDLSKANMEKLKEHFVDENNFYEREDGALRLNGKAEAYVSGWFGDIAYKREFLRADADKDGKLSEDEYQNTRNGFRGTGTDYLAISNKGVIVEASEETLEEQDTYAKVANESKKRGSVRYNDDYSAESIGGELNTTIRIDNDFSSTVELSEAYMASSKNINLSTSQVTIEHINDYYGVKASAANPEQSISNLFSGLLSKTKNKKNLTDDEEKAQKALQKLRAANGDESMLTAEEKEALGTELKAIKKQLESKDELNSVKDELKMKIESTQFIDVRG